MTAEQKRLENKLTSELKAERKKDFIIKFAKTNRLSTYSSLLIWSEERKIWVKYKRNLVDTTCTYDMVVIIKHTRYRQQEKF